MISKKNRANTTLKLAIGLFLAVFLGPQAIASDLATLDQTIAAGNLDEAAQIARNLDSAGDPTVDLTMTMARLGRAFQKSDDLATATEFYTRAVFASQQPAAAAIPAEKIIFVRLAAASAMSQTGKLAESLEVLRTVLSPSPDATDAQVQTAVSLCLRIGASGLSIGDPATAAEAYTMAAEAADENQKPTAMLGAAWAVAVSQVAPLAAAKRLAEFVEAYPDHADASRAARACAECLRQAERPEDANAMIADLLDRWPSSESALEVVRGYSDLAPDLVPPSIRNWILVKAKANDLKMLDAKATKLAMKIAMESGASEAWSNLAGHLATIDEGGTHADDVLSELSQQNKVDAAERLAASWVSPERTDNVTPAVREAACRWAGRNERWSMLALASESAVQRLDDPPAHRTEVVERLFAESLMQLGRIDEAQTWWNHLVDTRHCDDFATLLRCAEAETSVGRDVAIADQRISSAREAAADDRFSATLVDMLAAELAIRKTRFDEARGLLENVVRSPDIDAGLRGRAQWLIGETFYLQAQFAEAIEAYRRVEGIDPGGTWVSASLVQAGKSFEQLGRTREAAVCYGSLIGRFADSPHAEIARKRMAAIDPANPSSKTSIRR